MKRFLFALLACCAFSPAQAADPAAPVSEIMLEAVKGWAEEAQPGEDYFSNARLGRSYSQDFTKAYRDAAKFPAYDEGDSPFDYDVIVSGQDSCAIKDLSVTAGPEADGKSDVKVTFDNTHCFGERAADWKPSELHFMVIEEGGKPVIDDIVRTGDSGSLKGELQAITSQGASNPQ
jgi:opacity protein-like surface antigen